MIESLLNNVDNNDIDYDAIDVRDSDKEDLHTKQIFQVLDFLKISVSSKQGLLNRFRGNSSAKYSLDKKFNE